MPGRYAPLPANDSAYPPSPRSTPPISGNTRPKRRHRLLQRNWAVLIVVSVLVALAAHVLTLYVLPGSSAAGVAYRNAVASRLGISTPASPESIELYRLAIDAADALRPTLDPQRSTNTTRPGGFYRDPKPMKTALGFWALAESELRARGVDSCQDKLGRVLIESYAKARMEYCSSRGLGSAFELVNASQYGGNDEEGRLVNDAPLEPQVMCFPAHHGDGSNWWPYPAAPCVSRGLRGVAVDKEDRNARKVDAGSFAAPSCALTAKGEVLRDEMGKELFLGKMLQANERWGAEEPESGRCAEWVDRTVLVVHRQDAWNPFHVSEDLVTTLVTMFMVATALPQLAEESIQLVFTDKFGMDRNHFTPLYDRIGAWAPRRLALDPWKEGACLTNAIHSVGAGASLLSATGVSESNRCASTITWAASHYYRHLFGLSPLPLTATRRPLNILYISRAKLDQYSKANNEWSAWRGMRELRNEAELVARMRTGLAALCSGNDAARLFGSHGCVFADYNADPSSWSHTAAHAPNTPVPVRFATIDPTVHTLETQLSYVGHTSLLIGQHGGALGLQLFMNPGRGGVLELQVTHTRDSYHFEHMAFQTGRKYATVDIEQTVDVEDVWGGVWGLLQEVAKEHTA